MPIQFNMASKSLPPNLGFFFFFLSAGFQDLHPAGGQHLRERENERRSSQHGSGCGSLREGRRRVISPDGEVSAHQSQRHRRAPSETARALHMDCRALERKLGNLTADACLRRHRWRPKACLVTSFPQCLSRCQPQPSPPTPQFDSFGQRDRRLRRGKRNRQPTAHSTYHALQASLSGTIGHGGPGLQASYTWGKSIDDVSQVLGGTGSTGAVTLCRYLSESLRYAS